MSASVGCNRKIYLLEIAIEPPAHKHQQYKESNRTFFSFGITGWTYFFFFESISFPRTSCALFAPTNFPFRFGGSNNLHSLSWQWRKQTNKLTILHLLVSTAIHQTTHFHHQSACSARFLNHYPDFALLRWNSRKPTHQTANNTCQVSTLFSNFVNYPQCSNFIIYLEIAQKVEKSFSMKLWEYPTYINQINLLAKFGWAKQRIFKT